MKISGFDFGSEDARNIDTNSVEAENRFLGAFVVPSGFDIEDYFTGAKYFVFGGKGAGKSALLRYIQIKSKYSRLAVCDNYYFQSTFSKQELAIFCQRMQHVAQIEDSIIDDSLFQEEHEIDVFWKVFILTSFKKLLQKSNVQGKPFANFCNALEVAKAIARAEQVQNKLPALKAFQAKLSRDPSITLEGEFRGATIHDFDIYLDIAFDTLEEVFLVNSPTYIFIDEMEIYKGDEEAHRIEMLAIASLVKNIRDFNERYNKCGLYLIAAVRSEVVTLISEVLYEVHRIVRDRGFELTWNKVNISGEVHPLLKTILNRIVSQDDYFGDFDLPISDEILWRAYKAYFPESRTTKPIHKQLLDLTWYRPRDLALLFGEAQRIDGELEQFERVTLTNRVLRPLGERMWQDAISGLAAKYSKTELSAIDRLLRGGARSYNRDEIVSRIDDLADTYDDVALLSDRAYIGVLEDLYRVGVVFCKASNGRKNYYFRGDPMPSFSNDFDIVVHQTIQPTLSIA